MQLVQQFFFITYFFIAIAVKFLCRLVLTISLNSLGKMILFCEGKMCDKTICDLFFKVVESFVKLSSLVSGETITTILFFFNRKLVCFLPSL